jgi:hypothetical protein
MNGWIVALIIAGVLLEAISIWVVWRGMREADRDHAERQVKPMMGRADAQRPFEPYEGPALRREQK